MAWGLGVVPVETKMVVSASGFVVQRFSGGPLDLEPHRGVFEMGDMRCWLFLFVGLFR